MMIASMCCSGERGSELTRKTLLALQATGMKSLSAAAANDFHILSCPEEEREGSDGRGNKDEKDRSSESGDAHCGQGRIHWIR